MTSRSYPVEPSPPAPARRAPARAAERHEERAPRPIASTPAQCEQVARARLDTGQESAAFELLSRCADREDFVDLRPLLREPWMSALRARGDEAVRLLVRIAARSGEGLVVELGLLRDAGIDVRTLKGAEQAPRSYRDKLVLMRGRLEWRRTGKRRTLVGLELVPMTKDEILVSRRRNPWDEPVHGWAYLPSGRELVLTGDPRDCSVGAKGLQLLLVRVQDLGLADVDDESSDDDDDDDRERVRGSAAIVDCQADLATQTEGSDSKKFLLTRDR